MSEKGNLERVIVDLPNHWATSAESMWAFRLDDGTFQIDNVPFHAYGINYKDIVRVDASDTTRLPVVVEVIIPSDHDTIRVLFPKGIRKKRQEPVIAELEKMKVYVERAFENYIALDIPPEVDYDLVREKLDQFGQEGLLEYETCEARAKGRFDEGPDDEDTVDEYEN
jgi:hypothetical protein